MATDDLVCFFHSLFLSIMFFAVNCCLRQTLPHIVGIC
jgi:hypothetical protein